MLQRIRAALRSDRGEASAVSIVLGTLLFLTASTGSVAVVGNIMAATAVTRQNAIIESALKDRVQQFLSQGAEATRTSSQPVTETVTYQGVTFPLTWSKGIYNPPYAYEYDLAAPMATAGGAARADCTAAVGRTVPGCLSLSATRIDAPQDDAQDAGGSDPSNVQAFPGLAVGPTTVNTSQKVLNIVTVTPSNVLSSDPARIQVIWKSATAPSAVRYGFYCGTSVTPQALLTPTTQTYNGQVSLILELTPASLKSVSGCTTATIGLSSGGAAVPVDSVGAVSWWRILPVSGGPE
ncbi:hypothetical protein [Curtobacterium sp. MCSS17_016]|uniref:hypothetical protein n=1 Tax=Curtobacterium sp. MCSS17_016 TaxID=2175644 RepID=UPI000DA9F803|nr:hypothetical protein [Curtobacterium sp. MCSS17_016]WIE80849.1 hypothetical protein DEJ19_020245 [Curtobacterium sp. MCSS17_016]